MLEAYERLIHDAMVGDHTLFTTADGHRAAVGGLGAAARGTRRRCTLYAPGSWGPEAMHALIAPHGWRLPFARRWRGKR